MKQYVTGFTLLVNVLEFGIDLYNDNIMAIGWDSLGDLSDYNNVKVK